ncbi:DUF6177 family protein [Actinomadura alba]|uniref:Uncharacterized protein n=1 Tax=Actinomadura alba TaxID=406431 RepID=A0ABR7LNB9_9ACTN|nr:DUF6177 family protein [Actinomadura alba]MBC6466049.1 hypothetical protein [Actinomadura alba]
MSEPDGAAEVQDDAVTTLHPAVDIVTDKAAVVIQDRPVVPLATWLVDAAKACAEARQGLQILTSADARITMPLRMTLSQPKARWVVREPGDTGYFDGFSGMPLVWDGSAFSVAPGDRLKAGPSPTFARPAPELGAHLVLDVKVLHQAANDLVLGGTVERLATVLAGGGPAGWGIAEPALNPWDRAALTELCHRRSPKSTWVMFTGAGERRFIGGQTVSRVTSGVKEEISFVVGHEPGEEPPLDLLPRLAAEFAEAGTLLSMTVQRTAGRPDLTYSPRWCGAPAPVGLAIGTEAVREIGLEHAQAGPVAGKPIGPGRARAMWYPLGDGLDPAAWSLFSDLMRHLRPEGPAPRR